MKKFILAVIVMASITAVSQETFDAGSVAKFQQELNAEFAAPDRSPLSPQDRADFKSLDFYPPNADYFVLATFTPSDSEPFPMLTSTARRPMFRKYGDLTFTFKGKKMKLALYQDVELVKKPEYRDYLFLPFSDLTNGKETYIGGRYIDMKIPTTATVAIDFNKAYNPYCAYNHKYSCPAVPQENDLPVAINAGVKKFHD
ncbi:MAG: DUF1684 domain-containing protein [Flavobacterium sp.]|nr:MAG: DUF1684 domain-containing protein [Flavobacterium sp.]